MAGGAPRGNRNAVRHAAFAEVDWVSLSDHLTAELVDAVPRLAQERYGPVVNRWGRGTAGALLIQRFLNTAGLLDETGVPRPAVDAFLRFETMVAKAETALALDPVSEARFVRDVTDAGTDALESLIAAGRPFVEAAEARRVLTPPTDDRQGEGEGGGGATDDDNEPLARPEENATSETRAPLPFSAPQISSAANGCFDES
jgi:hypothetical protein